MITEENKLYTVAVTDENVTQWAENKIYEDYRDGYALIFRFSEKIFKPVINILDSLNNEFWDEVLEARIFTPEKELHIFETDGHLRAVEIEDTDDAEGYVSNKNQAIKKYEINSGAKRLVVREYLDYDEDGQMFVSLTRLCGVE